MGEAAVLLADRVGAAMLLDDRATTALGMLVESMSEGAASIAMEVRADMINGFATCHGGVVFALADSAFGFASNSRNQRMVAASCQIDYLKPAREGDMLRAVAAERSAGKRLGLYDVTITNQHGEVIALFRGRSCSIPGTIIGESEEARRYAESLEVPK